MKRASRIENGKAGKEHVYYFSGRKNIFTIDTVNTRYMFQIAYGKFPVLLNGLVEDRLVQNLIDISFEMMR